MDIESKNINQQKEMFLNLLTATIWRQCTEISDKNGIRDITCNDAKEVVRTIEKIFLQYLGFIPEEIKNSTNDALAFLGSSARKTNNTLTIIIGIFMGWLSIITGIGIFLGCGAMLLVICYSLSNFAALILLIIDGLLLNVMLLKCVRSSKAVKNTENLERALNANLRVAVDKIWEKYGDVIFKK